jgi:hypothetical protein
MRYIERDRNYQHVVYSYRAYIIVRVCLRKGLPRHILNGFDSLPNEAEHISNQQTNTVRCRQFVDSVFVRILRDDISTFVMSSLAEESTFATPFTVRNRDVQ